ncbi:MAG: hypothetical protein JG781_2796 [Peptococcaceae bacterium]|jgi:predicted nucleotidyltransferase|nr:hypothetical protein [Peptococcaceae bacterium]
MNIAGIIAEYNPFHLGHLYHLQETRKKTAAEGIICVMSGHFVQRGEPSLVNKWARAEMALAHGADLVLELPALYATRSAYWFARGGVETLVHTGIVTHLSFGVEALEPEALEKAAGLLARETSDFQANLKNFLDEGLSFPKARAQALSLKIPEGEAIWHQPNIILALSYLRTIKEKKLAIKPVIIERQGAGYHDKNLTPGKYASASAIREELFKALESKEVSLKKVEEFLPQAAITILRREFAAGRGPLSLEDFTPQLLTLLRRSELPELQRIIDIKEGLENRIRSAANTATSIRDFLAKLKTKRYTYTRLQRFLIHLLLNYTMDKEADLPEGPPYLRVLGFTSHGRKLLKIIKGNSPLPVITKGGHAQKYLTNCKNFSTFWEMEIKATNLYTLLYSEPKQRLGNLDYLRGPVYIPDNRHPIS